MAKAKYTTAADGEFKKEVAKSDYEASRVLAAQDVPKASENGFVGVDPIYQNFANEVDKPRPAEGGPEAPLEKEYYSSDVDLDAGATPEGEADAQEEDDDESTTTPSGSSVTPPPPSTNTPPTGN